MALMDERPPLASSSCMFVRAIAAPVVRGRHRQTASGLHVCMYGCLSVYMCVSTYVHKYRSTYVCNAIEKPYLCKQTD
jgi:hypothetical protein